MENVRVTRSAFFKSVWGNHTGYACIAAIPPGTRKLYEKFFAWPDDLEDLLNHVEQAEDAVNLYYCAQLLDNVYFRREDGAGPRVKENISLCTSIWADLDTCSPDQLLVKPSAVIESSPGRYQAIWTLADRIKSSEAEDISRRIAYYHASEGADTSGYDLTQLLRVPYSRNHKYPGAPYVKLTAFVRSKFRVSEFRPYPEKSRRTGIAIPMPEQTDVPTIEDPIGFLQERRKKLNSDVFRLFSDEPEGESWSEPLWRLMLLLFEGGLEREEVYALARQAACNKYKRDGRPDTQLWNDVCRAYTKHMEDIRAVVIPELTEIELITPKELEQVRGHETFVERYMQWASGLGDAAPQYHQAGALIILSSILSGRVLLPTSFGNIIPNLWFMLLADSTLSRKTTSMDIAMDLLIEVDSDAILATDGSIEGLLQGLSTRPGRPSVFLRDEFSGLLESMTKKDYMAGMAEMLTKLYDGKFQKRLLRKDPIEIREPVLILFTGGIRTRIQQQLSLDHVSSGFIPRFIFLTAKTDLKRVKPLGPPSIRDLGVRDELLGEIRRMHAHYTQTVDVSVEGAGVHIAPPRRWYAELTPEAWARFNEFEAVLNDAAVKSDREDIIAPVYARLGMSTLKTAVLLAASETREDTISVELIHILHAIHFATKWREYAIEVVNGAGSTESERQLERVYRTIERNPGVSRSALMQSFHLTARAADQIFQTLEQRGMISSVKFGKGTTYTAAGGSNNG